MVSLRRLIERVLDGGQPDPDQIRLGVMGALGHAVPALDAGGEVQLRWLDVGGGKVGCRVVIRGADGKPHITHFSGEGANKHAAAMVVYTMVGSAVGHSEGTPWASAAKRLYEGVEQRLREEGLLAG